VVIQHTYPTMWAAFSLAPMQPENDRTNPAAHILVGVGGRSNSSSMVGRCGRWNSNKS
jgi:hypothetical protein